MAAERVTEVVRVSADAPERAPLERAADILRAGGLVAFPTETVYGLGANAWDGRAVARIFAAKGRPATNPLIVHVASLEDARNLAADWPRPAALLAERFWPGPLTLVLPRADRVPDIVTAGQNTVAIRMPAHAVARALIALADLPIAAPSANRSSRLSPTHAAHVLRDLHGLIDMILDAGATTGGLESTVLDLTVTPPRLLRPGLVTPAQLQAVIGPIAHDALSVSSPTLPVPSPGMLARHYAPRAPLECVADDAWPRVAELHRAGLHVGWLTFRTERLPAGVTATVMPVSPFTYAAQLYAALHALDDAGVDRIVVELPPDTEEWLAVRDRLRRASTP